MTESALFSEAAFQSEAAYADVRSKAKRIRGAGGVRVMADANDTVVAYIQGDHNIYETTINHEPGKRNVAYWSCGCPWGSVSWGRSGRWKKYEGRMCAHANALLYEIQSRTNNGKTIQLDEKTPEWQDESLPVRTPGEFDIGKGKYAVKEAAMSGFDALVNGVRRYLHIGPNGIEADGESVEDAHIEFPTYHPSKGLNLREARLTIRTLARMIITAGSNTLLAAKALTTLSKRYEPEVTKFLTGMASQNGAEMAGLDHRVKEVDSLKEKMDKWLSYNDNSAGRTAANMPDSLRYTMVVPKENYTQAVQQTLAQLKKQGYKLPEVNNYWQEGNNYKGINVSARARVSGHRFELQFHTPESMEMKDKIVHPLYEEFRADGTAPERRAELGQQMVNHFATLQTPSGIESVGDLRARGNTTLADQAKAEKAAQEAAAGAPKAARRIVMAGAGQFDYYTVPGAGGAPKAIFRHYHGADDNRTEVWRDGNWVEDMSFAPFIFKGEPGAQPLSEQEATQMTAAAGKLATIATNAETEARAHWHRMAMAASSAELRRTAALMMTAFVREDTPEGYTEALINISRHLAPTIGPQIQSIADRNGGSGGDNNGGTIGLKYQCKGPTRMLEKIQQKGARNDYPVAPEMSPRTWDAAGGPIKSKYGVAAASIGDSLRYTISFTPQDYGKGVRAAQKDLINSGFTERANDNSWRPENKNNYRGLNCEYLTPQGHKIEVQFHTPESFHVKDKVLHPIFEEFRSSSDPSRRSVLSNQMADISAKITTPTGWEGIGKERIMATRRTAAGDPHTYYEMTTFHGAPEGLFRFYDEADDSRTEHYQGNGVWAMDNHLASHIFKGEPGAHVIDKARAQKLMDARDGKKTSAYVERGGDYWESLSVVANGPEYDRFEVTPIALRERRTAATQDDHFGEAWGLDEHPEQALPITYGENAKEAVRKQALKDFSFDEQQRLISEGGGKPLARNLGDLKIEGTMYEHLAAQRQDDENWMW